MFKIKIINADIVKFCRIYEGPLYLTNNFMPICAKFWRLLKKNSHFSIQMCGSVYEKKTPIDLIFISFSVYF